MRRKTLLFRIILNSFRKPLKDRVLLLLDTQIERVGDPWSHNFRRLWQRHNICVVFTEAGLKSKTYQKKLCWSEHFSYWKLVVSFETHRTCCHLAILNVQLVSSEKYAVCSCLAWIQSTAPKIQWSRFNLLKFMSISSGLTLIKRSAIRSLSLNVWVFKECRDTLFWMERENRGRVQFLWMDFYSRRRRFCCLLKNRSPTFKQHNNT